ncbi:MAG: hypothetical protein DYG94_04455 [Leptolyngbya sp. PLA3]|nr:MAG: hypothetical protein EDM82_07440 [Cyanobacteria bacterium CYA]MCE7967983.1 hypothetical protein [Leptolyngbya sp. PL-A3]
MSELAIRSRSGRGQRVSRSVRAVRLFARLLWYAVRDRKIDLIVVVVFGVVGAMAQIGAVAALLEFLRMLSQDQDGHLLQWHGLTLAPGLGGLMIVGGVLAGLLAIAALSSYFSTRRARAIGRATTETSVLRLFSLLTRAQRLPAGFDDQAPRSLGVRASRLMGLAVEQAVKLIEPSAQLIVLLAALLYLDARTTSLLVPAILVPAIILLRFNQGVRQSARTFYDQAALGFGSAVGRAMGTIDQHRFDSDLIGQAVADSYRQSPDTLSFFDTYDDIALAAQRSVLITSLFRPILLVLGLLLLGTSVTSGRSEWPEVVAYIVLLLQAVSRGESIISQLSMLNRAYTQVEPYMRLDEHVRTEPRPACAQADVFPVLQIESRRIEARPGSPVLLYTGRRVGRHVLWRLFEALLPHVEEGAASLVSAWLVGRRYCPSGATFAQLATGKTDPSPSDLRRLEELARRMGIDPDARLTRQVEYACWDDLGPCERALLQAGPAVFAAPRVLLLDVVIINQTPTDAACALLAALDSTAVIFIAPDYRSGCTHPTSAVVVHEDRVVWGGTISDWVKNPLRERLRAEAGRSGTREPVDSLEPDLSE